MSSLWKLRLFCVLFALIFVVIGVHARAAAQDPLNGRLVLVVDRQLHVLNLADNSLTPLETTNIVSGILPSPDGSQFAVISRENGSLFTIYDSATLNVVNTIRISQNYDRWIGWSPNGAWLLAGTLNSGVIALHATDGRIVSNFPITSAADILWLNDNRLLIRYGGTVSFPFFVADPEQPPSTESYLTIDEPPFLPTPNGYVPLDAYGLWLAEQGYELAAPAFFLHHAALQADHSSVAIQPYPVPQLCANWFITQNTPYDPFATPDPNADPDAPLGYAILYQTEAHALTHLTALEDGLLFVKWELPECASDASVEGRLLFLNADGAELQIGTDIRPPAPRIDSFMPNGRPYAVIGAGAQIVYAQQASLPSEDPETPDTFQQSLQRYDRAELRTTPLYTFEPNITIGDMLWLP